MAPSVENGTNPVSDEEDDYMNMTFEEPSSIKESSLQRTQRLKKESRERGFVKSKAQREAEDVEAREKALATSMLEDSKAKQSKGFAMMSKMGFTGGGLGKKDDKGEAQGRVNPINLNIKEGRGGIGLDMEKKRQMQEAAEELGISNKAVKLDPDEYRDRVRKEREEARMEKQFEAAQRLAERLDDEQLDGKPDGDRNDESAQDRGTAKGPKISMSSKPLKSLPVLYRGLVRHREEQERERRMRHDLEQSLPRLPKYDDSDDDDQDDKVAQGKSMTTYMVADDLDEEDKELDTFSARPAEERLQTALEYLRQNHHYCFWCKMAYADEDMEGCPGITEEEHD